MARIRTVIIVSDNANVSGGNSQVALLSAKAVADAGIRCIFFAANGSPPPELSGVNNLEFVVLEHADAQDDSSRARGALRGLWNSVAAIRFERLLSGLDAATTVVHVHSYIKALSSSIVASAAKFRFKVVLTVHDYFLVCPIGSLYNHQTESICPLKPMGLRCVTTNCDPRSGIEKGYRVVRQLVSRYAGKIPDAISSYIVVSEFSREILGRYMPLPDVHYIPNPVRAMRGERALVGDHRDFTYVGRLSPEKGVDLLVSAARETGLSTVVIGDGASRGDLEQHASPNVTFSGWLSQDEVARRLLRSRALILPSRWYEAAPLVIQQAASLGVPVIVSGGSAARSMIVDGVTGLTFKHGDFSDLAAKMRLLDSGDLADLLGRAAYERFWRFSPSSKSHSDELLAVYEHVLSEGREAAVASSRPITVATT